MIHRYLHDILTAGIAAITADPTIIEELFQENYELVTNEADTVKDYFANKGLRVANGYPRTDTEWPAVCIILADEAEEEEVIGDTGGMVTETTDPHYLEDIMTAIWGHAYKLLVVTDHPDVTAYYYEIVKFILLEGFHDLLNDGCFNFQLSGNELAPDPRYLPEHLFARQLVFKCQREFQRFDKASKLYRASKVSGIHIDSGDGSSDVGGVKTKVTTYTE